ncbi:MAG: universal stress protein [Dehalococcoidia bacterium]|nr:universal stress protein [Dehalococcoidia bacterium]
MYQKIVVPVDGSELAEGVLSQVATMTEGCSQGEVVFLRIVERVSAPVNGGYYALGKASWLKVEEDARARAEEYMKDLKGRVDYGRVKVSCEVIAEVASRDVADQIAAYVKKSGADLVVISTHGRSGISRWAWGSVADRLLRSISVPVLMVRAAGCTEGV